MDGLDQVGIGNSTPNMTYSNGGGPVRFKGVVTNYGEGGGGTKREGGRASEVLPLRKGGMGKVLTILKGVGGGTTSFGGFQP